jgi:hypothetical protein
MSVITDLHKDMDDNVKETNTRVDLLEIEQDTNAILVLLTQLLQVIHYIFCIIGSEDTA